MWCSAETGLALFPGTDVHMHQICCRHFWDYSLHLKWVCKIHAHVTETPHLDLSAANMLHVNHSSSLDLLDFVLCKINTNNLSHKRTSVIIFTGVLLEVLHWDPGAWNSTYSLYFLCILKILMVEGRIAPRATYTTLYFTCNYRELHLLTSCFVICQKLTTSPRNDWALLSVSRCNIMLNTFTNLINHLQIRSHSYH